jgi:hypothetical protein
MEFLQGINLVRDYCIEEDIDLPTSIPINHLQII